MKFPTGINIYAVSDSGFDHLAYFKQVIKAGADIIQFRDKYLSDCEFYEIARQLRRLAARYRKLFIINDRVDIVMAVDCDGVHLGSDDLPIKIARRLLPDKIIGYSAHDFSSAVRACKQGANYISVGPIFKSPTKKLLEPIPETEIQLIIQKIKLPLVAIGGINLRNIIKVKKMGFKNVAVISALKNSRDKKKVITKMRQILEK